MLNVKQKRQRRNINTYKDYFVIVLIPQERSKTNHFRVVIIHLFCFLFCALIYNTYNTYRVHTITVCVRQCVSNAYTLAKLREREFCNDT